MDYPVPQMKSDRVTFYLNVCPISSEGSFSFLFSSRQLQNHVPAW